MPNRTIYVADSDLPIFERAQRLAGDNLSATIAQALRRFVEIEEAKESGYGEVTVRVGKGRPYLQKQFRGRKLATRRLRLGSEGRTLTLVVYQTIHGRFALYSKSAAYWSGWSGSWSDKGRQHAKTKGSGQDNRGWGWDWDWDWEMSEAFGRWSAHLGADEHRLDVFENLEALREAIPEDMYESIVRYLYGDEIEFLDI
ncbi:MAG TPA: EXLDI protein [Ktedonobacteraceae bacterium]|nr:EXLDI protein [Ktedonobacteraceae bacterium]